LLEDALDDVDYMLILRFATMGKYKKYNWAR
jgi:hypothetical protein